MAQRDSAIAFSVDQAQRLFGKGLEVIGDRSGIESLFNLGKEIVAQQDKDIAEGNYQPEYTMGLREAYQQGGMDDAIGWVLEKSGENLASSGVAIAGGLAAALTAPFSVPVSALIGGATVVSSGILGTGEVAQEMEDKTGSYNSAVAIGAGTIIGILDRFGATKVIPKDELLTMTGKQLIKKLGEEGKIDAAREIGKRIGRATAFEAATEGTQEGVVMGSTALTGGEYTGLEVADRILEGTVLGGTMGGGTTTGIEAFRQGPGIYNFTSDYLSPPPGPTFGEQLAIQTATTLSGPEFARYTMQETPPTIGEILLNEGLNMTGGAPTTAQKIDENLQITDDENANIDENAPFFSKDLQGNSVNNIVTGQVMDEEMKKIEKETAEETRSMLKMSREQDQDLGFNRSENQYETADENSEEYKTVYNLALTGKMRQFKNLQSLENPDRPVVSPLRIKLNKLKLKHGAKTPIDVVEIYNDLRSQENRRDGSVGFLGREEFTDVEVEDFRYKPKEGKGKEFGQAVKAAPKTKDGRPDYTKIPNIDDIGVKINVPRKIKKKTEKFDSRSRDTNKIVHNRGGELFTSGLEEYLVRNKDEKKTMEEIIHEFDRMRPDIAFEVRSKLNYDNQQENLILSNNTNYVPKPVPFLVGELTTGDVLQGTATPQELQGTQRIDTAFATSLGVPLFIEDFNNRGELVGFSRNGNPALRGISKNDFEIDSISVVAFNPDQEKVEAGTLTNSPTIKALKEQDERGTINREKEDKTAQASTHDYYKKGHTYARAMIVRGMDNKLYGLVEEVQSDITRNYEALLDFSKPEYDISLKYGGLPALFTDRIDTALKGNDPNPALIDRKYTSHREMVSGGAISQEGEDFNLLTPSERQKIHILDQIDQNMPDDKAPSQVAADLERKKIAYQEAQEVYEDNSKLVDAINEEVEQIKNRQVAPQEGSKLVSETLNDFIKMRKPLVDRLLKLYKPKTISNIFSKERQQLMDSFSSENNNSPDIVIRELRDALVDLINNRKIQTDIKYQMPLRRADPNQGISPYDERGILKIDHMMFKEPKIKLAEKQGFFKPKSYNLWDKMTNYMPNKTRYNPWYNLLENQSYLTGKESGPLRLISVYSPSSTMDSEKTLEKSIASGDYNEQVVYENLIKRGMKELINQEALSTIQHRLASSLVSKYKDFLKDIDFHQILKNNMRKERFEGGPAISESDLKDLNRIADTVNMSDAVNDVLNILPEAIKIDAEKQLSRIIDDVATDIGFIPEDGGYSTFINHFFNDTIFPRTDNTKLNIIKEINKNPKKYGFVEKLNPDAALNSPHLINDKKLKKQILMKSILNNETYNRTGGIAFYDSGRFGGQGTSQEVAEKINDPSSFKDFEESHINENYDFNLGGSGKNPSKTSYAMLFLSPAYQDFLKPGSERLAQHKKEKSKALGKMVKAENYMTDNPLNPDSASEIRERIGYLKEEINKKAEEFNYKPNELKETLSRLQNHLDPDMDYKKGKYRRAPHNASMAQTARGMYKALINKLTDPKFEELYGEPIAGIVVPHRLSSWKQRAEGDSSMLDKKASFGKGTYGSEPQAIAKLFEEAGAEVNRDKQFDMLSKDGTKTISLDHPTQFILDISPGSRGRQLAQSKFTFRAKGGYIDLRRKAS